MSTRSCISAAAFSVKVRERISQGLAFLLSINHLILSVMTLVFPVPAPATTNIGPPVCSTAFFCSSFNEISITV